MTAITQQRCANHEAREAVARCVSCLRYFCRECVTEHGERMLCSACLLGLNASGAAAGGGAGWMALCGLGIGGLFLAWALFYFAGDLMAMVSARMRGSS